MRLIWAPGGGVVPLSVTEVPVQIPFTHASPASQETPPMQGCPLPPYWLVDASFVGTTVSPPPQAQVSATHERSNIQSRVCPGFICSQLRFTVPVRYKS